MGLKRKNVIIMGVHQFLGEAGGGGEVTKKQYIGGIA